MYLVIHEMQINSTSIYNPMKLPAPLADFYDRHNIRPFESTWLAYVHLVALAAIIYSVAHFDKFLAILPYFIAFSVAYSVGITGGCHRLWSHRSYIASAPLRVFLMLLNSGANQGSIYHWSRDHRLHHKFSDTELDPHTISKGFFFAHCGWLLVKKNPRLIEEGRKIDMSDLAKDSVVMWQKKYYFLISTLMCFILPTIVFCLAANVSVLTGLALANLTYAWNLNVTWCVNSICHMYGSRPWNSKIQPRDNYIIGILAQGEGYHNWHHEYPSDWRASKDEWYMFNLTARFIELMAKLKLATVKM